MVVVVLAVVVGVVVVRGYLLVRGGTSVAAAVQQTAGAQQQKWQWQMDRQTGSRQALSGQRSDGGKTAKSDLSSPDR